MAHGPDSDEETPLLPIGAATYGLVGVNILVAVAMFLSGTSLLAALPQQLLDAGAADGPSLWNGEVWRLLTACFVHVGVWHLALNMWVLLQVGRAFEEMVGPARTLLIYAVSGVAGFALSVTSQPRVTSGASGAIFGLVGALLAIAVLLGREDRFGRHLVRALLPFVGATLLLGLLVPMIDNTAHFAGLAMGFLLSYGLHQGDAGVLVPSDPEAIDSHEKSLPRRHGGLVVLCAFAVFFVLVAYAARPFASPRYYAKLGLMALSHKQLDIALANAERGRHYGDEDGSTLLLRARIAMHQRVLEQGTDASEELALATRALRAYGTDENTAFERAHNDLSLLEAGVDFPYVDARATSLLCHAAAASLGQRPAPGLKNDCAWLWLQASDPVVADVKGARAFAEAAYAESQAEGVVPAAIVHTLACTLAMNGEAAEGVALLEKLKAEGRDDELSPLSFDAELARLRRLAEAKDPTNTTAP